MSEAILNAAVRYREALETLQVAAALFASDDDPLWALVDANDGNLSWSAVHTFITNVVDLGMTAEAALADLADDPTGVQEPPQRRIACPGKGFPGIHGVPEQPQGG